MTSTDPAEDLVPCMRSVQLSDDDKQLMSAFKDKVDDSGQYAGQQRPLYRGGHIPSRLFRELDNTVSGGAPPSGARIGGPGQARTVVVNMQSGGATGPTVHPSQQEVPEPKKYTGGSIPSRSFRVLQQMTADDQGPAPAHQPKEQPRRSPSHYAHNGGAAPAAAPRPPAPPPASCVPTCERIERQQRAEAAAAPGRYAGGKIPSRAFQMLSSDYPAEGADRPDGAEAVLGELRAVGAGQVARPARPGAVPSRSFRLLQQEYGGQEQEARREPEPELELAKPSERQRLAATSKTYRMLQADPASVPSVFGRNRR
ncbi:translation initiation factor IF-2-like [Pollicipes pollicipes]|uniref:translation initiation factor IF-2-like n=1 Tax=Pollicipes pollicipes TaxID=41117 RepID=UPI00188531B2|nr:translation initiation factor IF-2-like [Pollicipes pollicipes]